MFENFLCAVGGDAFPPARRQAVLLTCIGTEGQRVFESLPPVEKLEGEDDFQWCLRRLGAHFAPKQNVCVERYRFRSRGQQPGETTSQWVSVLRQLASTCEYGPQMDEFIRDQVIEKTASSKLRQRLLMEGSGLTLEKTLTLADTLESAEREAKVMEGPAVPVPVQALQPQRSQRGGTRRRRSGPVPALQQEGRQQLPQGRQQQPRRQQPLPPQQPTAGPECWGCGRPGHRRGDRNCPAFGRKCSRCGKTNHFAQHCGASVVSSVQVLAIGASATPLTLEAEVEGVKVAFTVDSGSPVSILPRDLVQGDLGVAEESLCAYGGSMLNVLGVKSVQVSCRGKTELVKVYVVPSGRALMGLDLMKVFDVCIVGNRVCSVSTNPTRVSPPEPVQPTSPPDEPPASPGVQPAILGYQHRVTVDPGVPPVRQPLRRLPLAVLDAVSARIDELEAQGVVEKVSASPWISPLVVGRKRDGAIRLCVDMRRVNQAVITDGHPLPRIEDVLDRLRGSLMFSRLDLKDAYHQLELHPDSQNLTTFVSHKGLYRFRRVNFGLASAGPCFQRVMTSMLEGIPGVEVYLDDIIIHAPSQAEHDARLKQVLRRLEDHRVKVNWSKSATGCRDTDFLGYRISAAGVQIDPGRISPLLEAPEPQDEKGLRAFLGATGYHARFMPRYSDLVEPLRAALRADKFEWSPALSSAVQRVKDAIRQSPALGMFDPALATVLTTDASDVGAGACVTQIDASGSPRVIAYASKSFSPAERNYSTVEKEALAVVWACEKFRHYLWGRKFTLRTDHQALCTIFGPKGSTRVGRRVARWEARLLEFSFDVEYVRSERNTVADGLSRLPVAETWWPDDDDLQIAALTVAAAISEEELSDASAADECLSVVRGYVSRQWPRRREVDPRAAGFFQVRDELSVHGQLLLRGDRLVVPAALRERVLTNAHAGHQGVVRTKQRLRERFWWPRLDRQVRELLKSCEVCSQHDGHVRREKPPLQPIPLPDGPWQRLMVDVIGPMRGPPSERYGIVLVDMYSRWPEVALCQDATADSICQFLETVFAREGVPLELLSDNGPAFRSGRLAEFLGRMGVKQTFSSPYSLQTNGMVERLNRTVKEAIQSARLAREPRSAFVRKFLGEYRVTVHPATGVSPFVLMRGREARTVLDVTPSGRAAEDRAVRQHHQSYQETYRARYDRTATAAPRWEAGDWVRVRKPGTGRVEGQRSVQVSRRTGPVSYRLATGERVHARRLVPGHPGDADREVPVTFYPVGGEPEPTDPAPVTVDPAPTDDVCPEPSGGTSPVPAAPVGAASDERAAPRRSRRARRPRKRFSP
ncbi:uncharacterized protein K02A2.6-like [Amphibalanus amphitrite]|uniref:uncharacterized protein K02A2.6-like n=1 Tax=Amphibalanus amphitrite TaxID=1232801 RepID=UPI001C900270|nr:uncharacterized protein K02A2.6-like [Amphibalanus amphitrite]